MQIRKRYVFILYFVALAVLLPFRFFQLKNNINAETGHMVYNSNLINITTILLLVFCIGIILLIIFGKENDKGPYDCKLLNPYNFNYKDVSKKIHGFVSVISIIMCLALVYSIVKTITGFSDAQYQLLEGIKIAFLFLSFTSFYGLTKSILKEKDIPKALSKNMFIPCGLMIFYLVDFFIKNHTFEYNTQEVLLIITYAVNLLFFIFLIRFYSADSEQFVRGALVATSFIASLVNAVLVIPSLGMLFYILDEGINDVIIMPLFCIPLIFFPVFIAKAYFGEYIYKEVEVEVYY